MYDEEKPINLSILDFKIIESNELCSGNVTYKSIHIGF